MLLINNSVARVATGASDYKGYIHFQVILPTDGISPSLLDRPLVWSLLLLFFFNRSVLDLFFYFIFFQHTY